MRLTAEMLKAAVISYFRFKKQAVAVDEVGCNMGNCDVLADDGKFVTEIEVKLSKSDLIIGERNKGRHPIGLPTEYVITPNKYYLCVPLDMEEVATKWIEETSPNYGLFVFDPKWADIFGTKVHVLWGNYLTVSRRAKFIHKEYKPGLFRKICMRASASLCAFIGERAFRIQNQAVKCEETNGEQMPRKVAVHP